MATDPSAAFRIAVQCALLSAFGIGALAQGQPSTGGDVPGYPTPQQRNAAVANGNGELHVELVRQGDLYPTPEPSIYLLAGAGGNITVQVGSTGLVVINSGRAAMSKQVIAALRALSPAPLRTIINTDADAENSGGNGAVAAIGHAIAGGDESNLIGSDANVTTVIAADEVLQRMQAPGTADTQEHGSWPNDTYELPKKDMWFNGESIRLMHAYAAHSDGDSMVYFRHSDVVCAGDLYSTTAYPQFDPARGGSYQGIIDALNRLVYEVMIPGEQNDGGTLVIPNRGYISSFSDVVFYQEMLIIIRDRIQAMIDKHLSLEQVLAQKPTLEYDPRYGADSGSWTTRQFVTAVYQSLKSKPVRVRKVAEIAK
jgi:glyoxylase-like metal-dependent hydrolase (beta-lactamase superfamily II)